MELNKTQYWPGLFIVVWGILLLALGSWWLFLLFRLGHLLQSFPVAGLPSGTRLIKMITYEGVTFFFGLMVMAMALIYTYYRDHKRTIALTRFFAGLTHELKTPLASIRLQAEVIEDVWQTGQHEKVATLLKRLNDDSFKLEHQLDQLLQLSRLELGGQLVLQELPLMSTLKKVKLPPGVEVSWPKDDHEDEVDVMGDDFVLKLLWKNLLDNTKKHRGEGSAIKLELMREHGFIHLFYDDHGQTEIKNPEELKLLFVKGKNSQGSGIGLYLVDQLLKKMGGELKITSDPHLVFELKFLASEDSHA